MSQRAVTTPTVWFWLHPFRLVWQPHFWKHVEGVCKVSHRAAKCIVWLRLLGMNCAAPAAFLFSFDFIPLKKLEEIEVVKF